MSVLTYFIFGFLILFLVWFDLWYIGRKNGKVDMKTATIMSIGFVLVSIVFGGYLYIADSPEVSAKFFTAYAIEKALSIDNLFVMILIFGYFNVPDKYHHKVLFWGILGALVFRAIFIFGGVGLINLTYLPEMTIFGHLVKINVLLVGFGVFLLFAGIKSAFTEDDDDEKDFSKSPGAKFVKLLFPRVTGEFQGDKFFVKIRQGVTIPKNMVRYATPLLVVLGVIEFTDLLFAVDSIPAIFAIAPNEPFILYSSNIFAILGLRSLYFLLANYISIFRFLKYGLAVILSFIGIKMLIAPFIHISSFVSLGIVLGCLILSTILSILIKEKDA